MWKTDHVGKISVKVIGIRALSVAKTATHVRRWSLIARLLLPRPPSYPSDLNSEGARGKILVEKELQSFVRMISSAARRATYSRLTLMC